jgi:anti-sigma regulatory factor (Ser/Thr protein kinase)
MTVNIRETEDSLVIHCPADTCLIEEIQRSVCRKILDLTGSRNGFKDCLEDISVALDEILSNAMTHAYRNAPAPGPVDAVVRITGNEVVVTIDDYGDARWIGNYREPKFGTEEEKLRPDGRGVFIARKFMDGLEMRANEKGGTRIVMTKRL